MKPQHWVNTVDKFVHFSCVEMLEVRSSAPWIGQVPLGFHPFLDG